MNLEILKDFFNTHDRFCKVNHIAITKMEAGYAEAELRVSGQHLNGRDVVQGGALMTLADFVFAGAANACGRSVVSSSCEFHFIRPGTGPVITAIARKIHEGSKTVLYEVQIRNAENQLIGTALISGHIVSEQPVISC